MRNLPQAFADHLATGATTLCRCWKLIRRDGAGLGFTDHDQDVVFGGLTFAAGSGLDGSEAESKIGLAVGGFELSGALTSAALTDTDIAGGVWDNASVETWLVNWADASQRVLLDIGQLGEIRRTDHGFTAEVRGVAQQFDEERGRLYQSRCNADLGDARCGINLEDGRYKGQGTIAATDGRQTISLVIGAFTTGWFDGGSLTFLSGANAGALFEIRQHSFDGTNARFVLWQPSATQISVGDQIAVRAGCDKSIDICRAKFANWLNFRGFPSIPTNDFVLTYAREGDSSQNGGVLPI